MISNNRLGIMRIGREDYSLKTISHFPNLLIISLEYEFDGTARIFFECDLLFEVKPGERVPNVYPVLELNDQKELIFNHFVYERDPNLKEYDKPIFAPNRIKKDIIKNAINSKHQR